MKIPAIALSVLLSMSPQLRAATPATTGPAHDAVVADNTFAADIYAQLREGRGNICISPYSISSALDMVSAGAEGQTASQMMSVLHWTDDRADLPIAAAALTTEILDKRHNTETAQIEIASSLFGQKGYPYRKEFLDLLGDKYGAALQGVDYVNHPGDALNQINQWAASKTADKIKEALPPGAIDSATRLVLVNAVYFKDKWKDAFTKESTKDQPFYSDSKDSSKVPMMVHESNFGFMQDQTIQAVELPYQGDFSMVALLPRKRGGLPALEKSLSSDAINTWIAAMRRQPVEVSLPRFQMDCAYSLKEPLAKLGMPDAFDKNADFSGIASLERLKIDGVEHKTFITVDEQGTEAAAVTSVHMRPMAMAPVQHFATFKADHPFLFLIRHRPSGAILFIGRVENPQ